MSRCPQGEKLRKCEKMEKWDTEPEHRDEWRIREDLRDGCQKMIWRLWWICPYSKLVDGTVCSPANHKLLEEFIDENEPWLLIGIPKRDPWWHSTWNDTLWVQISTWRYWCHFVKVFMWWCNATCDSTLLIVTGHMNIQEDMRRGENPRWGNIKKKKKKKKPRTSHENLCADGTFRRCNQNPMSLCAKTKSFLNSWRIKIGLERIWRACKGSLGEKLDESWDADYVVEHVPV